MRGRWLAVVAALVAVVLVVAACGESDDSADDRPTIAVTTPALGALVRDLVGDDAEVAVVMPNGADPHEYRPSAKDAATLNKADLVVENGLELEEGLHDVLEQVRRSGPPVFTATDHVALRATTEEDEHDHADEEEHAEGEEAEEEHRADDGHDHGEHDPHIWLDPIAMRSMTEALVPVIRDETGLDVADRGSDLANRLAGLDAEINSILSSVPAGDRHIVTGHDSMGYFADRYGFEVVGVLLPSLSSQAEVSASNLAAVRRVVEAEGVDVIFNEIGTPQGVADAVAKETGARVVELGSHTLPDDGSYFTFMTDIARTISDAHTG